MTLNIDTPARAYPRSLNQWSHDVAFKLVSGEVFIFVTCERLSHAQMTTKI